MDILKEASVNEPVEVVCVVGEKLSDWIDDHKREESRLTLLPKNIRVVLYQELIDRAYKMYSEYLEKSKESGKVLDLIRSIKDSDNLQENE
jgi:hypothetical protein